MTQRLIVAGSRGITISSIVDNAILAWSDQYGAPSRIISGGAQGVDRLGEEFAQDHVLERLIMPAIWTQDGKFNRGAGYARNIRMAYEADALLAIWDGESKGTKHMIDIARAEGLGVKVVVL
ncbi:hypothetical protein LCGC14_1490350 [marine sediment metagenome]|uniref:DUF2493 domain-containing protein n=1 Tax=marine sediment metagenome TaxID=412755 RepID=A0A0F9LMF6_9ZZZZ